MKLKYTFIHENNLYGLLNLKVRDLFIKNFKIFFYVAVTFALSLVTPRI